MKKIQNQGSSAFSFIELLVLLAVLAVFVLLGISAQARTSVKSVRITCVNNLRQIALAFRIWEGGNGSHFPQYYAGSSKYPLIDSPNGTSSGFAWPNPTQTLANTWTVFLVMSNELNTPNVIACPADERNPQPNFSSLYTQKNYSCSYFVGRDAMEGSPQMFLAGDRNIAQDTTQAATTVVGSYSIFGGTSAATCPGEIASMGTNVNAAPLSGTNFGWNARTHRNAGNVALADGSAQLLSTSGLISALVRTGDTNAYANTLLFP